MSVIQKEIEELLEKFSAMEESRQKMIDENRSAGFLQYLGNVVWVKFGLREKVRRLVMDQDDVIKAKLDALLVKVNAYVDGVNAYKTANDAAIQSLKDQIAALQGTSATPEDIANFQGIADSLDAAAAALPSAPVVDTPTP